MRTFICAPVKFQNWRLSTFELPCFNYEDIKKWLDDWTISKDVRFYREGIYKLAGRWKKCIQCDK